MGRLVDAFRTINKELHDYEINAPSYIDDPYEILLYRKAFRDGQNFTVSTVNRILEDTLKKWDE